MRISAILIAALLAAAPAFASDESDIIAQIGHFNHGLDSGQMDEAFATCGLPVTIIDEFPPHVWSGPHGCRDWAAAFGTYNTTMGITDPAAKIGKPRLITVSGDTAYVIAPTTYSYKQNGRKVTEAHATLTIAFARTAGTWLMTAWSWTAK
jgi:ketosteroid isomerase-like protein